MGSGAFSVTSYASYSTSLGRSYSATTHRVTGQTFEAEHINRYLDPKKFSFRECVNTEEHPNTIPVILALDVTGSMGEACSETAAALGAIMNSLYEKFQDIEFCIMGIGDLAYDDAPIQMSQFESDVRIAEAIDRVYMEHGGGGNCYESYTAAWYMGLYHTKLDCWKQGRKGIIITMGDEPLNPYLPLEELRNCLCQAVPTEKDIETRDLYNKAIEKFDIFHIAVESDKDCYRFYAEEIANTFGQLLGPRCKVSSIDSLAGTIEECITEAVEGVTSTPQTAAVTENGEISW